MGPVLPTAAPVLAPCAVLVPPGSDARYSALECARLGIPQLQGVPSHPFTLGSKLLLLKPLDASADATITIRSVRTSRVPWGEGTVSKPEEVSYKLDGRTTRDIRELARWMRKDMGAVRVDAGPTIPHKFVVAVVDRLRAAEIEAIRFTWPGQVSDEYRRRRILPYPGTDLAAKPQYSDGSIPR